MTNEEITKVVNSLNERFTADLTLESFELMHTGGGCMAIGLYSKHFEILMTEEGTLPDSIEGPWMVGVYRLDDNGDNIDDGEIVLESGGLVDAYNAIELALCQQIMEEVDRPRESAHGQCAECMRSYGPHYTGPCEH